MRPNAVWGRLASLLTMLLMVGHMVPVLASYEIGLESYVRFMIWKYKDGDLNLTGFLGLDAAKNGMLYKVVEAPPAKMPTLFDGDLMINQKVKREFVWRSDQGFSKAKLEGIRSLADDLKCAYMMDDGTIVLEPCTDDAVLTDKVRLGMYPIQPEVNKLTYVIGGSRAKDNKVTKFNCVLKNINEVRGNKSVSNECLEDVNNNKYDRCNCETFRVTIAPPVVGEPKVVRDEL